MIELHDALAAERAHVGDHVAQPAALVADRAAAVLERLRSGSGKALAWPNVYGASGVETLLVTSWPTTLAIAAGEPELADQRRRSR